MLARAITFALVGLEPRRVEVEAHVQSGVPSFTLVGLVDRACQEAKQRVRSGIKSAQLDWPGNKSTVNLAPAELKKEGSGFDLPIALALLAASGQIPRERLAEHASCGELALDGRLRRVGGVLGVAEGARRAGLERIICAYDACAEAALAGVEPVGVRHLAEAVAYLRGESEPPEFVPGTGSGSARRSTSPTSAARNARAGRSSWPPRAVTTCSSADRPESARPCWRDACPASCPRSRRRPRSR